MADVTVTVNQGGGADYTVLQTAIDDSDVTTGFYKVEIQDNVTYSQADIAAGGSTGTPTIANYLWITATDAVYHGGDISTGTKVTANGNGNTFTCSENFVRFEKLRVSPGNGVSNECFRINSGITDLLIERCILDGQYRTDADNDKDGIYTSGGSPSLTVYNTLVFDHARANIHWDGTNGTVNLEFVTATFGAQGEARGNIYLPKDTGLTLTTNCYNNAAGQTTATDEYRQDTGTHTNNGSHNAADDGSGGVLGTNAVNNFVVADAWTDPTNFDYTIKDTNSALYQAGTDRSGSKPDSRVDAAIDIAGTTRPATPSIGAYELAAAGPDRSITATQDAFLATQDAAVEVRVELTSDQSGFLPTQAAALAVRATLSAVHTAGTPTQSASLGLIAGVSANQTTQLPTQDASLSLVQGLIATQTAFLPTQTSALALLSQVQGTQTTGLPSQTAVAQVLVALTASQTAPLATQDATVATADTRTVTADQDAFLATQAAALALQATLSADQSTLLPTQTASAQVRLALDANQDAFLATQTANAVVRLALSAAQTVGLATQDGSIVQGDVSVITGTQTAFLPTQAASFQALIQITGDQAAFLATQVAPLTVLAQISATQTAPGPATQTATLALLAKLSGVQTTPLPTQDATVEPVAPGVRGLNFAYLPTQQGIVAVRSDIIATQIIPKPTQTSSLQHVFFMTGDHTTQLPTQTGLIIQGQLPALGLEGLAPTRASLSGKSPTTTNLRGRAP